MAGRRGSRRGGAVWRGQRAPAVRARAPGVSLHETTTLSGSRAAQALAVSKTAASVCSVAITSTSFISCTGLKKCRPTNCSGRPLASACAVMGSDEVFEPKMASGLQSAPSCLQKGTLIRMSSTIASTTRSHSCTSSMRVA